MGQADNRCDETPASTTYAPSYNHEEIASFCLRSDLFGEEGFARAEGDWAQSEVGEGVEEVWERTVSTLQRQQADGQWNSAGRLISTLDPKCNPSQSAGQSVSLLSLGHRPDLMTGRGVLCEAAGTTRAIPYSTDAG